MVINYDTNIYIYILKIKILQKNIVFSLCEFLK